MDCNILLSAKSMYGDSIYRLIYPNHYKFDPTVPTKQSPVLASSTYVFILLHNRRGQPRRAEGRRQRGHRARMRQIAGDGDCDQ